MKNGSARCSPIRTCAAFEPARVVMEKKDGTAIESRDDPERSFDGQLLDTPWDDVHVAYFSGEALWTYLNTPFLYTQPGFATEEIDPIKVGDEEWRRLKVTFPDSVKSHTREQISFGPDGLLRRHDYTVDILGGATGLNYASDYIDPVRRDRLRGRDTAANIDVSAKLASTLPLFSRSLSCSHSSCSRSRFSRCSSRSRRCSVSCSRCRRASA
jgi:hypothetical protein